MRFVTITVRVDFPALSDLVAYLKQSATQQAAIDRLTDKVEQLTKELTQSTTQLTNAVEDQK